MGQDAGGPLVWARRDVALRTCPKPYITAESQTLVEEFFVRRRLGGMDFAELSARQVEAFVILEKALAGKMIDGQHNTR
jgi:DNA replicative helicase MCM subunit Mcm2 (Cdc46/Mcm family)